MQKPECGSFLFRNTFFNLRIPASKTDEDADDDNTDNNNPKNKNKEGGKIEANKDKNKHTNDKDKDKNGKDKDKNDKDEDDKDEDDKYDILSLAVRYGLPMLTHTRRDAVVWRPGQRSKPAVVPGRILVGSVHVVDKLREGFKSCVMAVEEGLLYHYRKVARSPPQDSLVEDRGLWRYGRIVADETVRILKAQSVRVKSGS